MTTLYSDDIRRFIHSRDFPATLQWRVSEEEYNLLFILFRDNFESFDGEDKLQIAMTIKEVMEKIRGDGIPIYLAVKPGNGLGDDNDES